MNIKTLTKISAGLVKHGITHVIQGGKIIIAGMKVLNPTKAMSREILTALRNKFGIELVQRPVWREYVTVQGGTSNKYHYFVVLQDGDDRFVAANAYGRIGYKPKVFDLGEYKTFKEALAVAKKKLAIKMRKGYEPTQIPR